LLEQKDWEPNKLGVLLLQRQLKENPTSFKVLNSFLVKLVPFWMGHKIETIGLPTTNFCDVPLMQ
jgi:hypothetical protein